MIPVNRKLFWIIFICLIASLGVKAQSQKDSLESNILIHPIDDTPSYPGGLKAWNKHLKKHIKPLVHPCDEGRVFLQFKVLSSGKVDSVKVRRSLCPLADENAVEIVKASGRWNPAYLEGKPIDSWTMLQIFYRYR